MASEAHPGATRHLVVVPHTHWDREWYRTHEQFRYRLVRLLDRLLDLLESDPDFRHFTLDGQLVVLDDYLEVRPAARERIEKLSRAGRLVIGPWYVLPDEWLVSGEALIRNLRLGLAKAAAFGGAMPVGYAPDQFGHVGQLPQLFAGFGLEGAVVWRGVGEDVDRNAFWWEAPDGTRVFTLYLRQGYGNAAHLPLEAGALAERLSQGMQALVPGATGSTLLLMNGSDHLEPQPGLPAALEAATARLGGTSFEIGTLQGALRRARSESADALPVHRGELRSGLRAPLLEGCASARAPQKRADFRNDRLLTRYLEPLAAWLDALGGDADPELIDLCWRLALENHPHDSICGCSVDAVHVQMGTRFARVAELAGAHLERVCRDLGARIVLPPGEGPGIAVWNPNGAGVARAEGVLEIDASGPRPLALELRDASGDTRPAQVELLDAGADLARFELPAEAARVALQGFPPEFTGLLVCGVECREEGGRLVVEVRLGEQPELDFDFEAAKRDLVDGLSRRGGERVVFRARRRARVRVGFVDTFPAHGLRAYRASFAAPARGKASALHAEPTSDGGAVLDNGIWRVTVAADGRVSWRHRPTELAVDDGLALVSEGDRGDEYSFDPVPGAERAARADRVRVRLAPPSGARAGVESDARYRVPRSLASDRSRRVARRVSLPARLCLHLAEGLDRLDLELEVDNTARDHRLRVHWKAPFAASRFEVESAFEGVERPIAPARDAFGRGTPAELPTGATPQRALASLDDGRHAVSVANRGSAEVEAIPGEEATALAITVLRAVGWLSRDDLAMRPGHAGPPLATPGAQVPGIHRAELSLGIHAVGDPERIAFAQRFAVPPLAFAAGGGMPLADGQRLVEIDDPAVLVTAVEPRPDGASWLRVLNASAAPRRVRIRWNGSAARRLEVRDLAGRPMDAPPLEPADGSDAGAAGFLSLRPWQLVQLRAGED